MKFAVIKNGEIKNIIEAEENFANKIGAVRLKDGFGIGDSFENGIYSNANNQSISADMLKKQYEEMSVIKIRMQYTETDEYKILREYLAKKDGSEAQFNKYNDYVERCKEEAHNEIYGVKPVR